MRRTEKVMTKLEEEEYVTINPEAKALPVLTDEGNVVKVPSSQTEGYNIECNSRMIGKDIRAIFTTPRLVWSDMMMCAQKACNELGISMKWMQGVFWGQVMEQMLLSELKENKFKYVLVMDYDSVFTKDDVLLLYAIMESEPDIDALVPMQLRRGDGSILAAVHDKDGHEAIIVNREMFKLTTVPVATGHFGLTMIRVKSLAQMSRPLFKATPNLHNEWEAGKMDEDIYFWKNMREAGLHVHMTPQVHIGHIELVVTWGDERINPFYQPINEWQAKGKPEHAFGHKIPVEIIKPTPEQEEISKLERV